MRCLFSHCVRTAGNLECSIQCFAKPFSENIFQVINPVCYLCTWQAKGKRKVQLRSEIKIWESLLKILRCRQFCCPPKLSGCPSCHVTVSLDSSVLLSREHHMKRPAQLALSERRPAVQKLRCFKLDSAMQFFHQLLNTICLTYQLFAI
jgi:hypothetical protein